MNTYLNDIARHFGFTFRNDLLFRIGDPYKQAYQPPRVAHPIVQHVPPMHFAVSCSIDPGWSLGRMVIRNTGLWSLPPAYHESNYHPQAEYAPEMQYGAWCQLWSTTYGSGRVLAFADSTLFSNFCVFQPGKAELLRGMLDWLNHTSPFDRRGPKLLLVIPSTVIGGLLVALGAWFGRRGDVTLACLSRCRVGRLVDRRPGRDRRPSQPHAGTPEATTDAARGHRSNLVRRAAAHRRICGRRRGGRLWNVRTVDSADWSRSPP